MEWPSELFVYEDEAEVLPGHTPTEDSPPIFMAVTEIEHALSPDGEVELGVYRLVEVRAAKMSVEQRVLPSGGE